MSFIWNPSNNETKEKKMYNPTRQLCFFCNEPRGRARATLADVTIHLCNQCLQIWRENDRIADSIGYPSNNPYWAPYEHQRQGNLTDRNLHK